MSSIDVNIINPFLIAAKRTINTVTQLDLCIGKPFLRDLIFSNDTLRIILGVTGTMAGQVIINIPINNAKDIASKMMCGMPVNELDDLSISAISELGNMILGNAATELSNIGIIIDITPPVIERGNVYMDMKNFQNVCVPMMLDNNTILEMNIVVKNN